MLVHLVAKPVLYAEQPIMLVARRHPNTMFFYQIGQFHLKHPKKYRILFWQNQWLFVNIQERVSLRFFKKPAIDNFLIRKMSVIKVSEYPQKLKILKTTFFLVHNVPIRLKWRENVFLLTKILFLNEI